MKVLRSQDKSDRKNNQEGAQLFVLLICVIDSTGAQGGDEEHALFAQNKESSADSKSCLS